MIVNTNPLGCANPPNVGGDDVYADSAVSVTFLGNRVRCKIAKVHESNITLNTHVQVPIYTTKTQELLRNKFPAKERRVFGVDDTPNNLIVVAELLDSGCSVHLRSWGFKVDL